MGEEIRSIPIENIVPHPGNRRVGGFDQQKLEQLAESIKAIGVQQPAVVRRRTNGDYELVTGERRWRACKIADVEDLPSVVRDVSDIDMLKIQTIENLQREDVHPLDEADGFRRLMDEADYSADQVAEVIGQTRSYVYHRLKLCSLSQGPRDSFIDGNISVGHAELIARLPADHQEKALDLCIEEYWNHERRLLPVKEVRMLISRDLFFELSAAPFKKDDADLIPEMGSCKECPKRTGSQPLLFSELNGKDCCTDRSCFESKMRALVQRRRDKLEASGETYQEVQGPQGWNDPDGEHAISLYNWDECKKSEEGAQRVIIVSGPEKGRITWGKVEGSAEDGDNDRDRWRIEEAQRSHEQRRMQSLYDRFVQEIRKSIRNNMREWNIPEIDLRLITEQFFNRLWNEAQKKIFKWCEWQRPPAEDPKNPWNRPSYGDTAKAKIAELGVIDSQLLLMDCSIVNNSFYPSYMPNDEEFESSVIGRLTKQFGIEITAIERDVNEEFKKKWERTRKNLETKLKKEKAAE